MCTNVGHDKKTLFLFKASCVIFLHEMFIKIVTTVINKNPNDLSKGKLFQERLRKANTFLQ